MARLYYSYCVILKVLGKEFRRFEPEKGWKRKHKENVILQSYLSILNNLCSLIDNITYVTNCQCS